MHKLLFGVSAAALAVTMATAAHAGIAGAGNDTSQTTFNAALLGVGTTGKNVSNNNFGDRSFYGQVLDQNNIDSGINSAQQGSVSLAAAVGGLGNLAVAHNDAYQATANVAALAAGSAGDSYTMNNDFGTSTFEGQTLNQNNINSGINSAQQGSVAVAAAAGGSLQGAVATNDMDQATLNAALGLVATAATNSLNNNFGNKSFYGQMLNQNNINSGINSAQQGGLALAASALSGPDIAVAVNDLEQATANVAGGAVGSFRPNTMNNNFGDNSFAGQVGNQNNINSGINSAQQGGVAIAVSAF